MYLSDGDPAMYSRWLREVRDREQTLGGKAPDGPSADQLEHLFVSIESLSQAEGAISLSQADGGIHPRKLSGLMVEIAGVVDSWLFPEEDPIAMEVRPVLLKIYDNLGNTLDRAFPQKAEGRRQYEGARAFAWSTSRSAAIQERKSPGSSSKFSLRVTVLTTLGWVLFKIGKWISPTKK